MRQMQQHGGVLADGIEHDRTLELGGDRDFLAFTLIATRNVPGLLEVIRTGRVVVANPLGSGVLENGGLLKYLPAAARHFLGALDLFWGLRPRVYSPPAAPRDPPAASSSRYRAVGPGQRPVSKLTCPSRESTSGMPGS